MGNLGNYQLMTTLAKKVGGPVVLLFTTAAAGYLAGRVTEAGSKKGVGALKSALKKRNAPCELKDQGFEVHSDGVDNQGVIFSAGTSFTVLEGSGDAILISLSDNEDNPHIVSAVFLASVSAFPADPAAGND